MTRGRHAYRGPAVRCPGCGELLPRHGYGASPMTSVSWSGFSRCPLERERIGNILAYLDAQAAPRHRRHAR